MKQSLEAARAVAGRSLAHVRHHSAPSGRRGARARGRTPSPSRTGWPSSSASASPGGRSAPRSAPCRFSKDTTARSPGACWRRGSIRARRRFRRRCSTATRSNASSRSASGRPFRRAPAPYTRSELEPLLVFHPGLELAGTRYAAGTGGRKFTTHDAIADNGTGGAYVVAEGVDGLARHRLRAHAHRRADRRRGSDRGLRRRVSPRSGRHSRGNGERVGRARHRPRMPATCCRPARSRCRRRCARGRPTSRASRISGRSPWAFSSACAHRDLPRRRRDERARLIAVTRPPRR